MIYLTTEQVLFIHDRMIEETGGQHGVGDLALLESPLARPRAGFGEAEFYPHLMTKAAVLMDGIVRITRSWTGTPYLPQAKCKTCSLFFC